MSKEDILQIEIDGKTINISRSRYAAVKLKDLRAFGYSNLTLEEVQSEIDAVIADGKLTVIGMFMQNEIKTRSK